MNDTPGRPLAGRLTGLDLVLLAMLLVAAAAIHRDPVVPAWLRQLGPTLAFLSVGCLGVLVLRALRSSAASAVELARHARALAPALERLASAVERTGTLGTQAPAPAPADALRSLSEAIAAGQWRAARAIVEAQSDAHPGSPESARAASVLDEARAGAERDLRARLEASQSANDPESVLDYHRQLADLIAEDALRSLDRDLIRWLMSLLMRRMRTGSVRPDVAALAETIAERFPASPEGASLRASLPTLRRSAGLCPRCAKPYTGIDEACPECLAPGEADADVPQILAIREGDEHDDAVPEETDGAGEVDEFFERRLE